jgi:Fe-S cluster assembly ATPase SufC
MLEIRNLHAAIGEKPILRGIDLTVPDGQIHAIMGPNGSGKSTLSYVLSGRAEFTRTFSKWNRRRVHRPACSWPSRRRWSCRA